MSNWVAVAQEGEIPLGECKAVWVDNDAVAVFHLEDGYHALYDRCTHEDYELSAGAVEGDEVECCMHGARFSIKSGEALCAPAYEAVHVFPVRVVDGNIEVRNDLDD
ncbi:MAG: non-heme iron oxygenase ferredoxin subunit [Nitrococcus sp.]|nr:non-heme iron oxygenase ferredoxin subunit [Nitrococcus sp.]